MLSKNYLYIVWEHLKTSIWAYPFLITLAHIGLAYYALQLDQQFGAHILEKFPILYIDTEGARQVLSVTASSMITVMGVVFSVTIVALSLASNQFGPKILRNYLGDTLNKVTLGLLVGVFAYGLVGLVFMNENDSSGPFVTISLGFALTLVAIISLIIFIHNISVSIQADHIVASVGSDLEKTIDVELPKKNNACGSFNTDDFNIAIRNQNESPIFLSICGYVQSINYEKLLDIAVKHDCYLDISTRAGKFLIANQSIGVVYSCKAPDKEIYNQIASCISLGRKRTPIQDLEFSIDQLVQVALRALSPGINDSSTAITCINWLFSGLGVMATREFPSYAQKDEQGNPRLKTNDFSFIGAIESSIHPVRQSAANNIMVNISLMEGINALLDACPDGTHKEVLFSQALAIYESFNKADIWEGDFKDVKQRFDSIKDKCDTVSYVTKPFI